jgi:hypothetical protein
MRPLVLQAELSVPPVDVVPAATLRTQGRYLLDHLPAALEGYAVTLHLPRVGA